MAPGNGLIVCCKCEAFEWVCAGAAAIQGMLGMLSMLRPLVDGIAGSFRQLSLHYLSLHKAVTKLSYIVTSLLSGVLDEGFCTATETDEAAAGTHCHKFYCGTIWTQK